MHPQEHKEKTINYILTPAVKCWHLVLKKSCKICFLKPRKCGKGQAASERCGFLPRQQTPPKEKWLPTQTLLLSHPRTNCVPRAAAAGRGQQIRALELLLASDQQGRAQQRAAFSSGTCCHSKPPSPKSMSQETFQEKEGGVQTNETQTPQWDSKGQGTPGSHAVTRLFQISTLQATLSVSSCSPGHREAPTGPGPSRCLCHPTEGAWNGHRWSREFYRKRKQRKSPKSQDCSAVTSGFQ